MKICYVANSRFPSERAHMTHIVHMCNAFATQGHEVTLLVTDRKTEITEIPRIFHPYFFFIQRVIFAYRAVQNCTTQKYNLLYGRDEWILWMLSFFVKTKIVWESHEARYSFAARRLLKNTSFLVVISEGIQNFYIKCGIEKKKIVVAHDAVDERFFKVPATKHEARAHLGITTSKTVVMYIGGLEKWKGAETLFMASEHQDVFRVYIVGGKEHEILLYTKAYPSCRFLGARPYRELPIVQQAADILVIPNTAKVALSAEYTSPLKLFSYMTAKKPIVASRIPSITNILSEDDAYFFTADDSVDLQRVIKTAIDSPKKSHTKAQHAYTKSSLYTWNARAQKILTYLSD